MDEINVMSGTVFITLRDEEGRIIRNIQVNNMIVNSGRKLVADLFAGVAEGKPVNFMGIGTGSSATTPETTALEAEIAHLVLESSPRSQLTSLVTEVSNNAVTECTALFSGDDFIADDEGELLITEAGLFTEDIAGTMYNRVTFGQIPLRKGYQLTLKWTVTFPSAG